LAVLPLPTKADGGPQKSLVDTIKYVRKTGESIVIVSSICPPYSTNAEGIPNYESLEVGISPNTQKHFDYLPRANELFRKSHINYIHFFLMADTEVDLLPFLSKLKITPIEFIEKCQESVKEVARGVAATYDINTYKTENIPPAARFLDYFGEEPWFNKYRSFLQRIKDERSENPLGRVARGIEYDYLERKILIKKLIGENSSDEEGIIHIARQKAQYMAFASLMREKFGRRLVVVNHRTPNLAWMNDKIAREPVDQMQLTSGNYLPALPLIELDISTIPDK